MPMEVRWDGVGTLSFGLSRFHGHGSWFECEVALAYSTLFMVFSVTYTICEGPTLDALRFQSVVSVNCQCDVICQYK